MTELRDWVGHEKTWRLRVYPHPGKYEGGYMVDEYVHEVTLTSDDGSAGDVQEYGAYYCRLECPVIQPDMIAQAKTDFDLTAEEIDFLSIVGAIVEETEQGFVNVEYFQDMSELDAAWDKIEAEFEEWSEEVESDE